MKVLCLIDSLASGGAERQMSYLTSGLKAKGCDVILAVFSDERDFFGEYIKNNNVDVRYILKGYNKYRRILEIIKLVKKEKPDATIAYKDGVTIAACLARLFTKFNLIVSERNTTQNLSKQEKLKFICYRLADKIIPNSFSQANYIKSKFPHLYDKTRVITNALDTQIFKPAQKQSKDKINIITTARVMSQKNTIRYVEAISKVKEEFPNLHFIWYGSQRNEYFLLVKSKLDELGLAGYVDFLPAEKDVIKLYNEADIFCLPSLYEGFPNVVCEAMACGLPVICSNVCDNPVIVQDGINGFTFDPHQTEDIANAIRSVVSLSSEERKKMGEENVKRIRELCSIDKFIDKYISEIDSLSK